MKAFPCPCPKVLHGIALTLPSSVQNQQNACSRLGPCHSTKGCLTHSPFPFLRRWVHDGPQTPHRPAPPALPALPLLQQPAPCRGGLRLQGPGPAHGEQRHRPVHGRQDPAVRGLVSTPLPSPVGWEYGKGLVRSVRDLLGVLHPLLTPCWRSSGGGDVSQNHPQGSPGKHGSGPQGQG